VGGDPDYIAGLDNFCWPNVVKDMPRRSHKLAQLVRANQGLYDFCRAYSVPLISGKDSMSNDSTLMDPPLSVPPTLLVSVVGRIDDISRALTLDSKAPGDLVYILGKTHGETGGSELLRCYGELTRGEVYIGNRLPRVNSEAALDLYRRVHRLSRKALLRSAHTPALGGLGIALARIAFAGGYGMDIDLRRVPGDAAGEAELLYAESNSRFVVTLAPENRKQFEAEMTGLPFAMIGTVLDDPVLRIRGLSGDVIVEADVPQLKAVWQETWSGE
jgi:phosphoribosylformylglycinamidine synthase